MLELVDELLLDVLEVEVLLLELLIDDAATMFIVRVSVQFLLPSVSHPQAW